MHTKNFYLSNGRLCSLCGCAGSRPFLVDRPDYEYGVGSSFNYAICGNPKCGLVYMIDIPPLDVIHGFYEKYSTHSLYRPSMLGSAISYVSSFFRKRYLDSIFTGRDIGALRVLDYGCGAGNFMRELARYGVGDVFGYDFDPEACKCAQDLGLKVRSAEEVFHTEGPYDFVFLNHVIEHLTDPASTLAMLIGSLNRGGRLVLRTPNARSFLARLFADKWRGWETPRHLHVFNPINVRGLVAKIGHPELRLVNVETSNAMFIGMFHESIHSGFLCGSGFGKIVRHILAFALLPVAFLSNWFSHDLGEEVVFVIEFSGAS